MFEKYRRSLQYHPLFHSRDGGGGQPMFRGLVLPLRHGLKSRYQRFHSFDSLEDQT